MNNCTFTENVCKNASCENCEYYNPKMTFFEAWEKAEGGEVLFLGRSNFKVTKNSHSYLEYDNGNRIPKHVISDKEWTIIPKKKKVTKEIVIPEGASNVTLIGCDFCDKKTKSFTKITYEIEE